MEKIAPKPKEQTESSLQSQCFKWFSNNFPELSGLLYHNYNNPRNAANGSRLRTMGLIKGIPDFTFAIPDALTGGILYFELKNKSGKLSAAQIQIHKQLIEAGHNVEIIRTRDEFINETIDWLDGFNFGAWSYRFDYSKNMLERKNTETDVAVFVGVE